VIRPPVIRGDRIPGFRDYRLIGLAALAGLVAYLALQVVPLWGWQEPGPLPKSHQNDFKHIYLGAWLLGQGQDPYDVETVFEVTRAFQQEDPRFRTILPYVYLPFTGQILIPLSWLPFDAAAHAWMLTNHLLLIGGIVVVVRASGWRPGWPEVLLLGAALALNATILRQNNAGQLNVVLFAGYALVFMGLVGRWHPAAVGGMAAFLTLFKLTPGILLLYFLCTRRWLHAAWMAGIGVALTLLGIALSGPRVWLEFLPVLRDMGYGRSTWSEFGHTFWRDPSNQSINSFLHHILVPWDGFEPWIDSTAGIANGLTMAFALVLVAATVACFIVAHRRNSDEKAAFSLLVFSSLLIPSIMWDHYLVQALIPAILLWTATDSPRWRLAIGICVATICLPVAFGQGIIAGWNAADAGRGAGLMLMSLKLWPTLILWLLAASMCIMGHRGEATDAK